MQTCNICGNLADRPYRTIVNGIITAGCVATIHDAHLAPGTNSAMWAAAAKKSFKKAGVRRLTGVGGN